MSTVFTIKNGVKTHDGRPLLESVDLSVLEGNKIGLIGRNGSGKSTLLRIIAGMDSLDEGELGMRKGIRIGVLRQNPHFDEEATGRQIVSSVFDELRAVIKAYEQAAIEGSDNTDSLLHDIERLGGWEHEHRIDKSLDQAGFPKERLDATVRTLSGGERKRLALAQLLLGTWDLLLLDEPTNHLDAQTVDGLQAWLQQTPATLVLITHDRYFLDAIVGRMVEVRQGRLMNYDGNYTDYLASRALEEAHREQRQHRQLRRLLTELEWARRSPQARTTKSKSRLQRIDSVQAEVNSLAGEQVAAAFSFAKAPRLGSTILEFNAVGFAYPGTENSEAPARPLLRNFTLGLRRGMRIGILGPNGIGKSTLLRLVMGKEEPSSGEIRKGKNTTVAYFDQHRALLDPELRVRETLAPDGGDTVFPPGKEGGQHVASWLDRFGFSNLMHQRQVSTLSGGEKNRLALSKFLLQEANLLILDEPTNDLDIPTLNLLEEAIAAFDGCVLLVSHDRYMLDKVVTGILAFESEFTFLEPGSVNYFEGNYTDYSRGRLAELRRRDQEHKRTLLKQDSNAQSSTGKKNAQKAKLSYKEQRELDTIEADIEEADRAVEVLQKRVHDPALWASGEREGLGLQEELAAAEKTTAKLYARWEELEAKSSG